MRSPFQTQQQGERNYAPYNESAIHGIQQDSLQSSPLSPLLPPSYSNLNQQGQQQSWTIQPNTILRADTPTSPSQPLPTHIPLHPLAPSPPLSQPIPSSLTTQISSVPLLLPSSSSSPGMPVLKPPLECGGEQNGLVERDNWIQGMPGYSARRNVVEEKSVHRVQRPTRFDIKDDEYEYDGKRSRP